MESNAVCPKCRRVERDNWDHVNGVVWAHGYRSGGLCFDCCALIAEQVRVSIKGLWIPDGDLEPPAVAFSLLLGSRTPLHSARHIGGAT
jgi:hypothetical protein